MPSVPLARPLGVVSAHIAVLEMAVRIEPDGSGLVAREER